MLQGANIKNTLILQDTSFSVCMKLFKIPTEQKIMTKKEAALI